MINVGFGNRTGIPSSIEEMSIDDKRKEMLSLYLDKVYNLSEEELTLTLVSQKNYKELREKGGSELTIKEGDIVYLDFHEAYNYECGYMHLALILKVNGYKAFVVPLTSNKNTCNKALEGKDLHLYYLGKRGSTKESCAFLNDAKWVNLARTQRIIEECAVRPYELHRIKERIFDLIL